jgi:hypothetical protein
MKKFHILVIILILGFFLVPSFTYACETKSVKMEKSCCKKDQLNNTNKKDCCKKKQSKNTNDCNGQCGDKNCISYATHYPLIPNSDIELSNNKRYFITDILQFHYNETYLSTDYYSIWRPPNNV